MISIASSTSIWQSYGPGYPTSNEKGKRKKEKKKKREKEEKEEKETERTNQSPWHLASVTIFSLHLTQENK